MHSFKKSKLMPYKAELIYNIIMDIEKYPEFLPWCKSAKIIDVEQDFLLAELFAEFKSFSESYVSKVQSEVIDDEYIVKTVAVSGPFKTLDNLWRIKQVNNGAQVDFSIDFAFKSKILEMIIGMFFSVATEKMIEAFESRASYLSGVV